MTPQPIDAFSFFPDSVVQFRGREYEIKALIQEPESDYFELGKFLANLPFIAGCGYEPSEGVTIFLNSIQWGEGLERHLNQINQQSFLDSIASSNEAHVAREILHGQKRSQETTDLKHQELTKLAMLETAFSDYWQGYKSFIKRLKQDYEQNLHLASEFSDPVNPEWSDLNDILWERCELFWHSCEAALKQALSHSNKIGWWTFEDETTIFSFGDSWFIIHDRAEDSYRVVPPTSDLLRVVGYYAGEDCVWFRDHQECELEHDHNESRVLYLDAVAPEVL